MFDQLFFNVFNHYKEKKNKNANAIAIIYITLLQSALLLFLGIFFSEFLEQMKMTSFFSINPWVLYTLAIIVIYFKSWIQYSGRKRSVRKANLSKLKPFQRNIVVLWILPLMCFLLSFIFLRLV